MAQQKPVVTLALTPADYFSATLLLAVAALCQYYHVTILAVLSGVLAVIFGIHTHTLSVDTSYRRYRLGHRLLGFTSGPWQQLPPIQRVVIKYFSFMSVSTGDAGGSEHNQGSEYTILLSVPGSPQAVVVISTHDYSKAVRIGCFLGLALGVEVVSFDQHKQQEVLQEAESR
jgi:TctA family transporter